MPCRARKFRLLHVSVLPRRVVGGELQGVKEAKAARYDTKDVITFMHAAFLSALCDLAFSGREYDMRRAMTEAYTIDDEVPPDDAPYPSDD